VDKVIIFSDGGKRKDITYGTCLLVNDDGDEIIREHYVFGFGTSNQAEYLSAIAGITRAVALDAKDVSLVVDSKLLKYQVSGDFECYAEHLRVLKNIILDMATNFEKFNIVLVRRNIMKQLLGH